MALSTSVILNERHGPGYRLLLTAIGELTLIDGLERIGAAQMDSLSHQTRITSRQDLLDQGFDAEQLEKLIELRDRYPFIEFLDSRQEWNRLAFLKWLVEQTDELKQVGPERALDIAPSRSIESKR